MKAPTVIEAPSLVLAASICDGTALIAETNARCRLFFIFVLF
jgi:hypothetical protein